MLNPQRLRVLQAVVAAGSMQAAARALHYSPATVSQHMAALSAETGLTLFTRDGRGLRPSAACIELVEHAEETLQALGRLDRVVEGLRHHRSEHLALSCFSSVAKEWMPSVVRALRAADPHMTVEISLNEPRPSLSGRTPAVDVRYESPAEPPVDRDEYHREELCVEEFAAALPAEHPLAARDSVQIADLAQEDWVDYDLNMSPTGRIIRHACQAAGFTPQFTARLDDHAAALSLVSAGLGVAVLPRLALADVPSGVTVRRLTETDSADYAPAARRRIVAHVHRRSALDPAVLLTMECLRECAAALSTDATH